MQAMEFTKVEDFFAVAPVDQVKSSCTCSKTKDCDATTAVVDKKNKGIGSRETRDCDPGSSLRASLAIFIYGDCGSPYSSYKSY
jgi:hypothetical protein